MIPVKISLPRNPKVIPELSGEAEFIVDEKKNALVIPRRSIVRKGDSTFVYVLENSKPIKKQIKLGIQNQTEAEVIEGIHEGQLVIIGKIKDVR